MFLVHSAAFVLSFEADPAELVELYAVVPVVMPVVAGGPAGKLFVVGLAVSGEFEVSDPDFGLPVS